MTEIKESWEIKKLLEVCEIKPPKKEAKDKLKDTDLVTFLPMEDLGVLNKEIIGVKERQLKEVAGSYTYFAENDVLLAKITPCFENGKIGIAKNLTNRIGFGSSEYIVFRSKGEIVQEYLYYFLSRETFRDEGKKLMTGAVGHKRVSKEFIENYPLPFPKSLPEQQRIVAILDEAFAAIAKAKANAEQNLKNAKELFESYLQGVFENKGRDWEEKTLGEVCELINRGVSPKYIEKSGMIVLNQKCIRDHKISFKQSRFHDGIAKKISAEKFVKLGDVLINSTGTGTLGRVAQVREKIENVTVDSHVTIVRPIKNLFFIDFFGWALIFIEDEIAKRGEGCGGQTELARSTLKNDFSICFPKSLKEQQTIVQKLDALSAETKKLESIYQQKLNDLEELKKSVLQKAFSGELKTEKVEMTL
jgi:type I restriction enzyme, S subunit